MLHRPGDMGLPPYRYRSTYVAAALAVLLAVYSVIGFLYHIGDALI
jgi:hypothetical protein